MKSFGLYVAGLGGTPDVKESGSLNFVGKNGKVYLNLSLHIIVLREVAQ